MIIKSMQSCLFAILFVGTSVPFGTSAIVFDDGFCFEEAFLYNTEIHINTFDTNLNTCSDSELAEIGQEITDAYHLSMIDDPLLATIVEMNVNVCDSLPDEEPADYRRLFFAHNYIIRSVGGQKYSYNWYGTIE